MPHRRRIIAAFVAALVALVPSAVTACGTMPHDADGTLDRARDGVLVVGVSEHRPWTVIDDEGRVHGSEADLIRGFADGIGAEIKWRPAPESVLAGDVKEGRVDVMIGGLTADTPWTDKIAVTRPYVTVATEDGGSDDMVMGVRQGENELLVELERHLAREHGEIR